MSRRRKPQQPVPLRTARAIVTGLGGLALILGLQACSREIEQDPLRREPALLVDAPSLARLLARTRTLVGTPAGSASARLLERLGDCREVVGHFARSITDGSSAGSASLLDQLVCRSDSSLDPRLTAALQHERGDHAGILQWPVGETGRISVWIDVDPAGGLAVRGDLEPSGEVNPASLLIPGASPPGAAAIDASASLVHVQLRPAAGLGLAELIPQGSQGDRLFALKGRLLEGALLEGSLEFAFLPPAPGGSVPLALLALHHRAAAPIEAALAEALDQLERTWAIARTPRRFATADGGARTGGCFADLPILPEFAPCWVVTDKALLVGYRAEALEAALAGGSEPGTPASRLVVDFDRVRAVDAKLSDPTATGMAQLYSRLELQGRTQTDGRVALEGELRARP